MLEARQHIDRDETSGHLQRRCTWCRTGLDDSLLPTLPREVAGVLGVFKAPGDEVELRARRRSGQGERGRREASHL